MGDLPPMALPLLDGPAGKDPKLEAEWEKVREGMVRPRRHQRCFERMENNWRLRCLGCYLGWIGADFNFLMEYRAVWSLNEWVLGSPWLYLI